MSAPLTPGRLKEAAHYYTSYAVVLPAGIPLDEALKPAFWSHVASKLRQHDTIRIIPEEGGYFAEALVLSSGRGFTKVKLLHNIPLDDEAELESDGPIEVKWRGPHSKWSLIRKSDGAVIKENIVEKADALREAASSLAA